MSIVQNKETDEIEKKYLVNDIENFLNYIKENNLEFESYEQMYLQMKEPDSFVVLKDRSSFFLVINDENSLQEELKLEITEEKYNELKSLKGKELSKDKFAIDPLKNTIRVRVIDNDKAVFCVKGEKSKNGLSCPEIEFDIEVFAANYLKNFENTSLEKKRYKTIIDDNLLEIDEYSKSLNGLYTIEVEFDNEDSANAYELPQSISQYNIEDITNEKKFSNYNLSKVKSLNDVLKKKNSNRSTKKLKR